MNGLEATHKDILLIDSIVHEGPYAEALKELWLGQLPLELAFWTYAVIYDHAYHRWRPWS